MCGRARCTLRADGIPRACHVNSRPVRSVDMNRYQPSNNVSPGRDMPVIRREDGGNADGVVLQCMKWGLIPSFTKKTDKPDYYKMFNARSESICEKASFRRLIPNNRCLVTVEGFYEWKKDGSKKQPYYIHLKDGRPLVFAALYDSWKNSEGEILYTFTIVTTSSSSALEWLHDRMPVILGSKESADSWLIGSSSSSKFETLLKPYEEKDLAWYPVTPAMGKPSFDGPECIKEIKLKVEAAPISSFFSKKVASSKQEANPALSRSDEVKSLKEEPDIEESLEISTLDYNLSDDESKDSKPNISDTCLAKAEEDPLVKRDYDEFSADTTPSGGKIEKACTSSARKKGKVIAASDKQPTLFSFFGRKP